MAGPNVAVADIAVMQGDTRVEFGIGRAVGAPPDVAELRQMRIGATGVPAFLTEKMPTWASRSVGTGIELAVEYHVGLLYLICADVGCATRNACGGHRRSAATTLISVQSQRIASRIDRGIFGTRRSTNSTAQPMRRCRPTVERQLVQQRTLAGYGACRHGALGIADQVVAAAGREGDWTGSGKVVLRPRSIAVARHKGGVQAHSGTCIAVREIDSGSAAAGVVGERGIVEFRLESPHVNRGLAGRAIARDRAVDDGDGSSASGSQEKATGRFRGVVAVDGSSSQISIPARYARTSASARTSRVRGDKYYGLLTDSGLRLIALRDDTERA